MIKIDQLITQLILDARNGKEGLTDKYRLEFRRVIEDMMHDKNSIVKYELEKIIQHAHSVIDGYK